MALNFVKFIRGTQAAYDKIQQKDSDTLYFITDKDSDVGSLYLGSKLIGGNTNIAASELGKVVLDENLGNSQFLVYDSEQDAWVNKSISEISAAVMTGAKESIDGLSGLVPQPIATDKDLFLKGDGTWSKVPASSLKFDTNIFATNSNEELTLNGLEGVEKGSILTIGENNVLAYITPTSLLDGYATQSWVTTQINAQNHLTRKIVDSVDTIDLTAEDVEKYIYMVAKTNSSNDDIYTEYIVIETENGEKKLELLGSTSVDLADYISSKDYLAEVGDLNKLIAFMGKDTTLVDTVIELGERMAWTDIYENTEEENK